MAPRRVTLNEILRLSRRVFLALGAGPGCEHDPALAVEWLESRGLAGLAALGMADAVPAPDLDGPLAAVPACLRVEAGGGSGLWLAAGVADWVIASAPGGWAQLAAVRSPLGLVPYLALHGARAECWLGVRERGGAPLAFARCGGAGLVLDLWRDAGELAGVEASVSLGTGVVPGDVHGEFAAPRERLSPGELDARHAGSLGAGIEVDASTWATLVTRARASLVPESDQSRARGAGAAARRSI